MLKRLIYTAIFLSSCLLALPIQAADFIEQVEQRYHDVKLVQADFQQNTYIELLEREQKRSGSLSFAQNQFRIDYKEPTKQLYVFDGKTLWIYTPQHKEVEVYPAAGEQIGREALSFLSGLSELRQLFQLKKNKAEQGARRLVLIPKQKDSRLKQVELLIDETSLEIRSAVLWPKQGNQSTYTFSQLRFSDQVPAELFQFKAPPGTTLLQPEF